MKRGLFLLLFVSLSVVEGSYSCFAQNLDSLQLALKNAKHDTTRVNTILALGEEIYSQMPDSALALWTNAQTITEKNLKHSGSGNLVVKVFRKQLAASLNNIGYVYNQQGDIPKSLEYFHRSLKIQEEIGTKEGIATSLNNIGYIYDIQGDIPKALEYYGRSLRIHEEIGEKKGVALCLNNIGTIYNDQGDIPKALEYYGRSLKISEEIGDKKSITGSLNNIGYIYQHQGDIPKALEYYGRCLMVREEIGDKQGIGISLNNIGNIYENQGHTLKALEYYGRSLKICEELGDKKNIATSLNNIGFIYDGQGDILKALEHYGRSLKIQEELGDKKSIASSLRNIGGVYSKQGDTLKALEYYGRSLKINEDIWDKAGIATSLSNIGGIYYKQKDYPKAEKYLKRSMRIGRELGYPEVIRDAAGSLFKLYKATGKHELALGSYEVYIQMRDSINNIETQKATIKQQTKYEYEKRELAIAAEQEKKDAIATEQLRRKNQQRNAFIGGFALMLILAGVSFRSYHIKKRDNGIITAQKEVVEKKNHEILESINYAKKLQTAVLPPAKVVKEFFSNSFLLYLPRDIVSGDFYWMENKGDTSYFAVADCTGHGVPGAMLSIIGLNGLNRALNEKKLIDPKDILTSLSETVNRHFEKSDATVRDGMDICLCALDNKTKKLTFSGANNPLWIARDNDMLILKGDRRAIGHDDLKQEFTQQEFQLQDGDTIYLASDGYQDQLGGKKYLKMMTKVFRTRLLVLSAKSMEEQRSTLISDLDTWKGKYGQTDDVCVMGIRI